MSFRIFEGNVLSAEGWRMCNADECVWVTIPGAAVTIQVRSGIPAIILPAFVARYNQLVEPVRDADTACWTLTNSVSTSNHPAGVAVDINWGTHEFHAYGTFGDRLPILRQVQDEFRGCIQWGGDWGGNPQDEMHHELSHPEGYLADPRDPNSFVLDVDQRLIDLANDLKAGYLGIYVPGAPPPPPPPPASNAVDVLVRATGVSQAKSQEILVGVVNGLRDSQCTNVNRIAMWLAQIGHESAGFNATEEYQNGDESTDRWKYKGRTWIQITWQSNYAGLSQWAFGKGLIPTATYFVDNPKKLAEIQYAGLGPAWYWTVARPQINSLCDARDLVAVTQAINGGQNGAADRKNRYDRALALGDQLLALTTTAPPTQGEDDLSAEAERKISEMYDEWQKEKLGPSRSFMATDGRPVASPLGFIYNIDGNVWSQQLTWAYLFDVPLALEVVESVAQNGSYAGSWVQSNAFNAWLNEFGQAYCQGLVDFKKALVGKLVGPPQQNSVPQAVVVPADNSVALTNAYAEIARLREENARLQAVVSTPPAPLPAVVEPTVPAMTSGDHAGKVIDSVEEWTQHILAMDTPQRAAFTTSMKALELPNGSQS